MTIASIGRAETGECAKSPPDRVSSKAAMRRIDGTSPTTGVL